MSRRAHRAWLVALAALAGCIEPSKIENAEELISAASLRDGGASPEADGGGTVSGGSGGSGSSSAGTGATGGSGGAGSTDCGDVVADFLTPTCANEFCHGATGTSPLKLMASDTASSLIGTAASAMCEGELYIDPDAPEQSLLYTKLGADPPCGMRMPFGGTAATDAQRACVLQWITDEVAAAP